MSDVMQGIEQDVVFDHATCEALANFCTNTASLVDGQAGSRAGAVSTGSTDFQGRFSRIFQTNAETAARDRGELTGRLRELATFARELADQARAEQQRREKAREWKRQQDDRNTLELIGDFFTGLINVGSLRKENEALRKQVEQLQTQAGRSVSDERVKQELLNLLELEEKLRLEKTVAATVISMIPLGIIMLRPFAPWGS